jgi:hypothetical protein
MEMPKPTDEDSQAFRSLVPNDSRVEVKPMFGNLAAFVNGNIFMGLFGSDVGVKLSDRDRELLLAEDGAGPFGPEGRPMGGYVTLPAAWRSMPERSEPWITRSLDHVGAFPAKQRSPRKSKSRGTPTNPTRSSRHDPARR